MAVSLTGLLNGCVNEVLAGSDRVFWNTNRNVKKAVGVGEEIAGRIEAVSVRDDKPMCKLSVTVLDRADDICVEGAAMSNAMFLGEL